MELSFLFYLEIDLKTPFNWKYKFLYNSKFIYNTFLFNIHCYYYINLIMYLNDYIGLFHKIKPFYGIQAEIP